MNEKEIIEFAKLVGKLKTTVRTGWKMRGVKNPESVAEHSFRTALLAMLIADNKNLDTNKLIRMALLHDLEEAIIGDITTPHKEKLGKNKIIELGKKELQKALSSLPNRLQQKYIKLWLENEEGKTKYSKMLQQIDRIEMMIQCLEYQKNQPKVKKKLNVFWNNQDKIKWDPYFQKIYDKLKKMRK
ncbi:MAG: HD domain-containing protein [Candidatus Aenigmarchaeota archaeon]|nr:HD domain-containing protein [Candidatus Aenigmarchaeota archaeon]